MKEHIKLAHAHVNQHTTKGVKTDWKVEANKTNEYLGVFPKKLDHNEVFDILNFARKFELDAFNIGVHFGKEEYKKTFENTISEFKQKLEEAAKENERLADALDRLTRMAN